MSGTDLEARIRQLEKEATIRKVEFEHIKKRLDNLSGGINRGLWIIGGGFLATLVSWVVGGGMLK